MITPNDLDILLHYNRLREPHPRAQAPVVRDAIEGFLEHGILKPYDIRPQYHLWCQMTDRGRRWLKAILEVPYPEEEHGGPDDATSGVLPRQKEESMDRGQKEPGMAGREKYWAELGPQEQVERMRRVVKALFADVNDLHRLVSQLQNHTHVGDKVHRKIESEGLVLARRIPPDDGKVWF